MPARSSDPEYLPAVTGVQPGTPNAVDADAEDLADGPPSTADEVHIEPTDDG